MPLSSFGKYQLVQLLARGGMAEIHLALEQGTLAGERYVVIKRILPKYADDPDFTEFFVDEGKVCLALSHPNVVQAYELGEVSGVYYLALEYVRGESLIAALRRVTLVDKQLSIPFIVRVAKSIAAALDHAHNAHDVRGKPLNVIHRDVSPHNILLGWDGCVKLADFGIARAESQDHRTATGVVKGKFAYLAPEALPQLVGSSAKIDQRVDLFGLGIVIHEMITRRPLFRGKNDADTVARLLRGRIPSPDQARHDCPASLARVVMKALERKPENRYSSAAEMMADLEVVAAEARGGDLLATRNEIADIFDRPFRNDPTPVRSEAAPKLRPMLEIVDGPAFAAGADPADLDDGPSRVETRPRLPEAPMRQPSPRAPLLAIDLKKTAQYQPMARPASRPEVRAVPEPVVHSDSAAILAELAAPPTTVDSSPRLPIGVGSRYPVPKASLPLPPPPMGGSAPRPLPVPEQPPAARAFQFGTPPPMPRSEVLLLTERKPKSRPMRVRGDEATRVPGNTSPNAKLPVRGEDDSGAYVHTGEFDKGEVALDPAHSSIPVFVDLRAVERGEFEAGEMIPSSPRLELPRASKQPRRLAIGVGLLLALALLFVMTPSGMVDPRSSERAAATSPVRRVRPAPRERGKPQVTRLPAVLSADQMMNAFFDAIGLDPR